MMVLKSMSGRRLTQVSEGHPTVLSSVWPTHGMALLLINRRRTGRGVRQAKNKERPPKVTTTKIGIVIQSFEHPFFENHFGGLTPYTRKIGLPESRVLYTVLRSPHIDKKSREQFEMEIKKEFLVIKIERHELHKKFFRLKRCATRRT
ncbi:Ribosomal protein S10 [Melia azedarach]|uniref:Ribosomal protein S10 n=1 Tax=Melia azedarach TaxID=155640 RepID=A0ACC1YIC1_MELAZ|nr:Ribosomal protein S10 [Melia azedarach]